MPPPHTSDSSSPSPTAQSIQIKLREIPFFAEINESKLSTLASYFEFRRCEAGEVICREGDEANGFSVLVQGEVKVSASGPGGAQVTLNTLKEGDWFGEIALVQNTLRTATLTSITPCLLLYISSSRFTSFLSLAPELRQRLFDSIISRRTANSLKAIPLFGFLARMENGARTFDEQKLQLLGEMFTFEDYRSNHVVFEEGDKADAFYIIQKGTVGVYARKGANDEEMMAKSRQEERNRKGGRRMRGAGTEDDDDDEDEDSSSAQDDDSDSGCSCSDGSPKHGPSHPQHASSSSPQGASATSSSPTAVSPATVRSAGILLNELTKNDWFGEIALVSNTRRTATVITKTPCIMFKLLSRDFDRFLAIVPQVKDKFSKVQSQRIATTLSNIPFFRVVRENKPAAKLTVLGGMFTFEHYEKGQAVAREGELFDKFVIIVDGTVDVRKSVQIPDGPDSVLLESLKKNNWFGEMQLIQQQPMLTSFICRDDCLVLSVTRDKFNRFIKIAPEIVDHFSKLVTYRTASMLHDCDLFEIREDRAWSKLELFCSMFDYEFVWQDVEVMREGQTGEETDKFYIVQQGSVRITTGEEQSAAATHESTKKEGGEDGKQAEEVVEEKNPTATTATSPPTSGASSASSSAPGTPRTNLTIHISTPTFQPTHTRTPSSTVLEKGAYFGELSLLLRHLPRPHTVRTLSPCIFLTLPPGKFRQFCKVAPEIRLGLGRRWPQYAPPQGADSNEGTSPFDTNEDDTAGGGGSDTTRASGSGHGDGGAVFNIFKQRIMEEQKLQRRQPLSTAGLANNTSRRSSTSSVADEQKQ